MMDVMMERSLMMGVMIEISDDGCHDGEITVDGCHDREN